MDEKIITLDNLFENKNEILDKLEDLLALKIIKDCTYLKILYRKLEYCNNENDFRFIIKNSFSDINYYKILDEPRYYYASCFNNFGLAVAGGPIDNKYGIVDESNNWIIKPEYFLTNIEETFKHLQPATNTIINKIFLYELNNNINIPYEYEYVYRKRNTRYDRYNEFNQSNFILIYDGKDPISFEEYNKIKEELKKDSEIYDMDSEIRKHLTKEKSNKLIDKIKNIFKIKKHE